MINKDSHRANWYGRLFVKKISDGGTSLLALFLELSEIFRMASFQKFFGGPLFVQQKVQRIEQFLLAYWWTTVTCYCLCQHFPVN